LNLQNQETELKGLVEEILAEAKHQGADHAEVAVSMDQGLTVAVRKGELENLEFNNDKGFGITLLFGQRKGTASTSDSSPSAISDTVAAAKKIAQFTQEDPCHGLADAALMPEQPVDLDLFHEWDLSPDAAMIKAQACEAAALAIDDRINNSDGAQVSTQQSLRVYGNSHGFVGGYCGTRHGMSCVVIAEDKAGMQRDYWYTTARQAQLLESAEAVGRKAGERTVARLSPKKAPTGSFPVLFSASSAAGLVSHFLNALSGASQYRKASFLLDSIGTEILPKWLTLRENPLLSGGLGSAYFDGDGVATRDNTFVAGGVVEQYLLSDYSARQLGMQTTGNAGGVHNLDVLGETQTVDSLLRDMGTGLWVFELMGQGVNGVTGDYSRGAAGFWVENGEVAYPVDEVTIASNLKDMGRSIAAMADDYDYRGNVRAPSMLVAAMTIAGA
tara:strand:- start:9069 stop:10400 length:1332 start_codon:yes stop_codon:yes gene_type:complete